MWSGLTPRTPSQLSSGAQQKEDAGSATGTYPPRAGGAEKGCPIMALINSDRQCDYLNLSGASLSMLLWSPTLHKIQSKSCKAYNYGVCDGRFGLAIFLRLPHPYMFVCFTIHSCAYSGSLADLLFCGLVAGTMMVSAAMVMKWSPSSRAACSLLLVRCTP